MRTARKNPHLTFQPNQILYLFDNCTLPSKNKSLITEELKMLAVFDIQARSNFMNDNGIQAIFFAAYAGQPELIVLAGDHKSPANEAVNC